MSDNLMSDNLISDFACWIAALCVRARPQRRAGLPVVRWQLYWSSTGIEAHPVCTTIYCWRMGQ